MTGSSRSGAHANWRPRLRLLVISSALAAAAAWLIASAAPPSTGRALFGLWRVRDLAVVAALSAVVPLALCRSRRTVLKLTVAATTTVLALDRLLSEDSTFYGDLFPHAVKWRGIVYLEDGLHRAVRAALRNRTVLHARVFDMDMAPGGPK